MYQTDLRELNRVASRTLPPEDCRLIVTAMMEIDELRRMVEDTRKEIREYEELIAKMTPKR